MNPRRRRKLRVAHRARRRRQRDAAWIRETIAVARTFLLLGKVLKPVVNMIMQHVFPPVHLRAPEKIDRAFLLKCLYAP